MAKLQGIKYSGGRIDKATQELNNKNIEAQTKLLDMYTALNVNVPVGGSFKGGKAPNDFMQLNDEAMGLTLGAVGYNPIDMPTQSSAPAGSIEATDKKVAAGFAGTFNTRWWILARSICFF